MTAWRQVIELSIGEDDLAKLVSITRSRAEPASRVERARMLLSYRQDPSFFAVGHCLGVHHQTVQRCVERALVHGPLAALESWRPGSAVEIGQSRCRPSVAPRTQRLCCLPQACQEFMCCGQPAS